MEHTSRRQRPWLQFLVPKRSKEEERKASEAETIPCVKAQKYVGTLHIVGTGVCKRLKAHAVAAVLNHDPRVPGKRGVDFCQRC